MPTVFIISEDWTLRTAVRAELLEQGIEALGFECSGDALPAAASGHWPALVVADDASAEAGRTDLSALLRRSALLLVVSGTRPPSETPPGAVVMRRPTQVREIVARARQMLEGQPA